MKNLFQRIFIEVIKLKMYYIFFVIAIICVVHGENTFRKSDEDAVITAHTIIEVRKYVENHNLILRQITDILQNNLISYQPEKVPEKVDDALYVRRDCADIYQVEEIKKDGVYVVYPDGKTGIKVFCDMTTAGGGWTVFQRRQDGSVNFNQSWSVYKNGFGKPDGEFWIGNDNLALITKQKVYRLHIDLQDFDLKNVYAEYEDFLVLSEDRKYRMIFAAFDGYNGTAGDSLWPHSGNAFSTYDRDNDISLTEHCAQHVGAGFWFYNCQLVGLNNKYSPIPEVHHGQGIVWRDWHGSSVSLKRVEMKFRPMDF